MNCRTFHKNLEDYLQDGLDFSGRFGMERHARQCLGCGKDMADAQELRRKVLELKRVKAPANFESVLLAKIGTYKSSGRFSAFRRFLTYELEWPSLKKLAVASSSLAVLTLGIVFSFHLAAFLKPPAVAPAIIAMPAQPNGEMKVRSDENAQNLPLHPQPAVNAVNNLNPVHDSNVEPLPLPAPVPREFLKSATSAQYVNVGQKDPYEGQGVQETENVEITIWWPDNRPAPMRPLPKKIRIQYLPASEDYFIQNVSH
jgi:hypothetical protein